MGANVHFGFIFSISRAASISLLYAFALLLPVVLLVSWILERHDQKAAAALLDTYLKPFVVPSGKKALP
jgi:hypothetical protein